VTHTADEPRASGAAAQPRASDAPLPPLNLFGYLSGNMGHGVAARSWLRRLLEAGVEVWPVDVPDTVGRSGHEVACHERLRPLDAPAPHDVNFFCFNPTSFSRLVARWPATAPLAGRRNVLLPFWELPRLPRSWLRELPAFDVVVAATRFIADAFRAHAASAPPGTRTPEVVYVPLPLGTPTPAPLGREAFGLPRDALVFVAGFELHSDVARKNPWAVLEAFARAFPAGAPGAERARLVVKLNNADGSPAFAPARERLTAAAAGDPRLRVIDATLPHAEVLALWACADAWVSLHRAEGLGLGPLEAMALGVPAIATAWSGNLDYMDAENAFLVGHRLVPVRAETQRAYFVESVGPEARWAEPDVDDAAAWMRRIAADPDLARARGARAAADVARRERGITLDGLARALARATPAGG